MALRQYQITGIDKLATKFSQGKIGIYKITSPTGRVYIGQSRNIGRRLKRYIGLESKAQTRLHNSFLKHGVENHFVEILEECAAENLNLREEYFMSLYRSTGINGLNCRGYAEGKFVVTDETRMKLSANTKGKPKSEAHKAIIGLSKRGNTYNRGRKRNQSALIKWRESVSASDVFKEFSKKFAAFNIRRQKAVQQINPINNEVVATFHSIAEANKQTGADRKGIINCCKGKGNITKGFKWSYA